MALAERGALQQLANIPMCHNTVPPHHEILDQRIGIVSDQPLVALNLRWVWTPRSGRE